VQQHSRLWFGEPDAPELTPQTDELIRERFGELTLADQRLRQVQRRFDADVVDDVPGCGGGPERTVTVGGFDVPVTGDWQTWATVTCALAAASGVHDVYLVYGGGDGFLFNVEWLALRQD